MSERAEAVSDGAEPGEPEPPADDAVAAEPSADVDSDSIEDEPLTEVDPPAEDAVAAADSQALVPAPQAAETTDDPQTVEPAAAPRQVETAADPQADAPEDAAASLGGERVGGAETSVGGSEEADDEDDIVLPTAEDDEEDLPEDEATTAPAAIATRAAPPVRETLVLPLLSVTWPPGLAPDLARAVLDPAGPDPRRLVAEIATLWDALAAAFVSRGPGCLSPDGVRWSREAGWQLALTPGYDWHGTFLDRTNEDQVLLAAAWRHDLRAIVLALIHAAVGRRPVDAADARRLADLDAGHLPTGLDALVQTLSRGTPRPGDLRAVRRVTDALSRPAGSKLTARCFLESATGSRKAQGNGRRDNEDVALSRVTDRTARLAIFDGTTDDGSGSGYAAARSAAKAVTEAWNTDVDEPAKVLTRAEAAVCAGTTGASTAVVARAADGWVRLAALGDSAAWLVRPDSDGGEFVAWRLTPSHTVFAEQCRVGVTDACGHSEITRFLGGAGGDPFLTEFTVAAGDLLLLATDGATAEDRDEWFGDVLCRLARERAATQRSLAAGLAADLIIRAEALGGWDNATALVTQFSEA